MRLSHRLLRVYRSSLPVSALLEMRQIHSLLGKVKGTLSERQAETMEASLGVFNMTRSERQAFPLTMRPEAEGLPANLSSLNSEGLP